MLEYTGEHVLILFMRYVIDFWWRQSPTILYSGYMLSLSELGVYVGQSKEILDWVDYVSFNCELIVAHRLWQHQLGRPLTVRMQLY